MVFCCHILFVRFFFFNDTATTEIYTLSLHDALPIYPRAAARGVPRILAQGGRRSPLDGPVPAARVHLPGLRHSLDRKSTRLNSSHSQISYAVFCLKKKTPYLIDPLEVH